MTWRVYSVDVETRGTVKTEVLGGFGSRGEAEKYLKEQARPALGRETTLGVEEEKPRQPVSEVVGPVPSDRGRRLQRRRERAEKITAKAERGEVLSIDERRYIEGGSGREPTQLEIQAREQILKQQQAEFFEKKYRVAETRVQRERVLAEARRTGFDIPPKTRIEIQKDILTKQKALELSKKQEQKEYLEKKQQEILYKETKELPFEKAIKEQRKREIASQQRAQRAEEFYRAVPGLRGEKYIQVLGRKALAAPAVIPLQFGEAIGAAAEKSYLAYRGWFRETPEIREATTRELFGRAPKEVPKTVVTMFDPREPAGAVNILAVVAPFGIMGARARAMPKTQLMKEIKKLPKSKQETILREFERIKRIEKEAEVPVREIELKAVEKLSPKAADVVTKFVREKDIIVGGSVAERAQVVGIKKRKPSDVDIYSTKPIKHAEKLATQLKKEGVERVSLIKRPLKQKAEITIGGEKAIEFHTKTFLYQNIAAVSGFFYPRTAAITKTPAGVKILKLAPQAKRMLVRGTVPSEAIPSLRPEYLRRYRTIRKSLYRSVPYQVLGRPKPSGVGGTFKLPSVFVSKRASLTFDIKEPKIKAVIGYRKIKRYPKYPKYPKYKIAGAYPSYPKAYPRVLLYGKPIPKLYRPSISYKPRKYPMKPLEVPPKYPVKYPPRKPPKYPLIIPPKYPPKYPVKYSGIITTTPPKYPPRYSPIFKQMIGKPPKRIWKFPREEEKRLRRKRLPSGFGYWYREFKLKDIQEFL